MGEKFCRKITFYVKKKKFKAIKTRDWKLIIYIFIMCNLVCNLHGSSIYGIYKFIINFVLQIKSWSWKKVYFSTDQLFNYL